MVAMMMMTRTVHLPGRRSTCVLNVSTMHLLSTTVATVAAVALVPTMVHRRPCRMDRCKWRRSWMNRATTLHDAFYLGEMDGDGMYWVSLGTVVASVDGGVGIHLGKGIGKVAGRIARQRLPEGVDALAKIHPEL